MPRRTTLPAPRTAKKGELYKATAKPTRVDEFLSAKAKGCSAWRLPRGVVAGVWDYLHSEEIASQFDDSFGIHPLFELYKRVIDHDFTSSGWVVDLGCGTGRSRFGDKTFLYRGIPSVPSFVRPRSLESRDGRKNEVKMATFSWGRRGGGELRTGGAMVCCSGAGQSSGARLPASWSPWRRQGGVACQKPRNTAIWGNWG